MADVWGGSWGTSWGTSWGQAAAPSSQEYDLTVNAVTGLGAASLGDEELSEE